MAFSKPVSAAKIQSMHHKNHPLLEGAKPIIPPPPPSLRNTGQADKSGPTPKTSNTKSWQDWKTTDDKVCPNFTRSHN